MAKSKGKRKIGNWSAAEHQAARDHKAAKKARKAAAKSQASGIAPAPYTHKRESLKHDTAVIIESRKEDLALQRLRKLYEDAKEKIVRFDGVRYEREGEEARRKEESDALHKAKSKVRNSQAAKKYD